MRTEGHLSVTVLLESPPPLDWAWLSGMPEAPGLNPSIRKNEREEQKGTGKKEGEGPGLGEAPGP